VRGDARRTWREDVDLIANTLTELLDTVLAETSWNLSRNTRRVAPGLRDLGHMSAHGRYFHAEKADIEKTRAGCRIAIEEFLRISGLL
jgi:hypothetical protein